VSGMKPAWRGFHRLNAYVQMRWRQRVATVRMRDRFAAVRHPEETRRSRRSAWA
jgi:hypothetical protein